MGADWANSMVNRLARRSRRNCCRNSTSTSGSSSTTRMSRFTRVLLIDEGRPGAREDNPEFGELAGLRIDLNRPAVLLDDDVVTNGQAKSSSLACGLRREERVEQL